MFKVFFRSNKESSFGCTLLVDAAQVDALAKEKDFVFARPDYGKDRVYYGSTLTDEQDWLPVCNYLEPNELTAFINFCFDTHILLNRVNSVN